MTLPGWRIGSRGAPVAGSTCMARGSDTVCGHSRGWRETYVAGPSAQARATMGFAFRFIAGLLRPFLMAFTRQNWRGG